MNNHASKEIQEIFGSKIFDTPKPTKLIKHLLEISTNSSSVESETNEAIHSDDKAKDCHENQRFSRNNNANAGNDEADIILDFFAGSGTTAHAVMEQNAADGGNCKFILVQIDELIDESKSKTSFDFCKNELNSTSPVISDIAIERVKRAVQKIKEQGNLLNQNADLGFCVYDIKESDKIINNPDGTLDLWDKNGLSKFDEALNLALQSGKMLDIKLEEICTYKLYKFDDSYFIIGLSDEVLEILEKTNDEQAFISGYSDINLEYFLNLQSVLDKRLNVVY
ncbi:DNA methyltransferase [Campylobacter fetus]|uniref:DNA methyltransferase n=1 Tax=Campylobacter fetus TaxID=196 RepID=UPI000FCC334E|nr:DNA methyltransferase [Campylobacter fetus]RUT51168.1 hypothetical protein BWK67_01210 [Campylobacter fetus]RUT51895.1 hypothetical protein BWK51_01210 [Campylobacter fetus]